MTRLEQLNKQIARLGRRAEVLNAISRKYWTARRIIFVGGALLALAFCNFAGSKPAWFVAALLAIVFSGRHCLPQQSPRQPYPQLAAHRDQTRSDRTDPVGMGTNPAGRSFADASSRSSF